MNKQELELVKTLRGAVIIARRKAQDDMRHKMICGVRGCTAVEFIWALPLEWQPEVGDAIFEIYHP